METPPKAGEEIIVSSADLQSISFVEGSKLKAYLNTKVTDPTYLEKPDLSLLDVSHIFF